MEKKKEIERSEILKAVIKGDCSDAGINKCNECPYWNEKAAKCKLIIFGAKVLLTVFDKE